MIDEFLSSFPFAETTKRTYALILADLVTRDDVDHMSAKDLVLFVEREGWGNSRRCLALAACQRFIRWRYGAGHAALGARIKRQVAKRQRVLSADDALRLLASFDTSAPKGARDLAIAALALDAGLRCAELCRLKAADVDLETCRLQVIVKGGQWAWGTFSAQTSQYLREWIAFRAGRGDLRYLIVSTRSWNALTPSGLNRVVTEWGRSLGMKLSPHDLRRSFATLATIFGAPSRVVQVAGRWSDIALVERYTRDLKQSEITPYLPVTNLTRR